MARGRRRGDHDAKRVEIAAAACRVFLRRGLEQTSLADIAREIGSTTGVLRHYFVDKDELLLFSKNLVFDRSLEGAVRVAAHRSGLEVLRAIAMELLPVGREAIDAYRLLAMFNGSAIGNARLIKLQDKRNAAHLGHLAKIISQLQDNGTLPMELDASLEAGGILALIDGLAEQVIMRANSWSQEQMMTLLNRHIDSILSSNRKSS